MIPGGKEEGQTRMPSLTGVVILTIYFNQWWLK
jgi:hypothetical protein